MFARYLVHVRLSDVTVLVHRTRSFPRSDALLPLLAWKYSGPVFEQGPRELLMNTKHTTGHPTSSTPRTLSHKIYYLNQSALAHQQSNDSRLTKPPATMMVPISCRRPVNICALVS